MACPADGWLADKVIAGGTDVTMTGDARVIVSANANLPYRANLAAIVALANHARPLVALVRACELLFDRTYPRERAVELIGAALAKVHAVAEEGR